MPASVCYKLFNFKLPARSHLLSTAFLQIVLDSLHVRSDAFQLQRHQQCQHRHAACWDRVELSLRCVSHSTPTPSHATACCTGNGNAKTPTWARIHWLLPGRTHVYPFPFPFPFSASVIAKVTGPAHAAATPPATYGRLRPGVQARRRRSTKNADSGHCM